MRNTPADAEVVSHQLLLRAGFIRRVTSGVYDYLPLGLRVLRKIEAIVREEMNRAGAQELLMPMVQPSDLWQKSGRLQQYGPELARFNDRHNHESCLGPTHEEVICDLVAHELRSYKQLPMNLYQIQTKFRDEIRPRFGLMRGREFIMKDAYSFHADDACLAREYENMFAAYQRIFTRLGLEYRAVEADNGSIGGSASHEFHVLADSGEDEICHCSCCDYAANVEKARAHRSPLSTDDASMTTLLTPNASSVAEVSALLGKASAQVVKTMVYRVVGGDLDGTAVAVCICGDDEVQEVKLTRLLQADEVLFADDAMITDAGGVTGFVGPCGLSIPVFADVSLQEAGDLVVGANKVDHHLGGVSFARDAKVEAWADIRKAQPGDRCSHCDDGVMQMRRGIEVGHVFALGRCYTEPMQVEFQNEQGKRSTATMGCYGIGVSRLMAAVIEQCNDEAGIAWPLHLAPFQVSVVSLGLKEPVMEASATLYEQLTAAGIDVLWDDRKERPGVKFRDHELIGIPWQLVVGDRGLERGVVECSPRGGERIEIPLADVLSYMTEQL
jgi:prolyl-tRNA synthetase